MTSTEKQLAKAIVVVGVILVLALVAWMWLWPEDVAAPEPGATTNECGCGNEAANPLQAVKRAGSGDDEAPIIDESEPAESEFEPPKGNDVRVSCVDTFTRMPIPGFVVSLEFEGGGEHSVEAQDGQAMVPGAFTHGRVSADGYLAETLTGPATGSAIQLSLNPLVGTGVVLQDGAAVADCAVQLVHLDGDKRDLGVTDESGRFAFPSSAGKGFELYAESNDAIGNTVCLPGQASATIHLLDGAGLRVMADQPLPPLEVHSYRGLEGRYGGGNRAADFDGMIPFRWVSVRYTGGAQIGQIQLGPPGSRKSLVIPLDIPTVWVHMHDGDGSPIAVDGGVRIELVENGVNTAPRFESAPPRVQLSLGSIAASGRWSRLEILDSEDRVAWRGYPSHAKRDGDTWSLSMRAATHLTGTVVDLAGQAVESARVAVGELVVEDSTITDAEGRFELSTTSGDTARVFAEWRGLTGLATAGNGVSAKIVLQESRSLTIRVEGYRQFTAAWRAADGPWAAPVSAVDGTAEVMVPAVHGKIVVRAGVLTIEQAVDAEAATVLIDPGNPVRINVTAEIDNQPAPGVEVNLTTPARDGPVLRARFFTDPDGLAEVTLPKGGMWVYTSTLGGGYLNTATTTTLRLRSSAGHGKAKVFGLMNWQPDTARPLVLYQCDQFVSEPASIETLRERRLELERVKDIEPGTLSYTASMNPELPFILTRLEGGWLAPVGVLSRTRDGWRCDLTIDDNWQSRAEVSMVGARNGVRYHVFIVGNMHGRPRVVELPPLGTGEQRTVAWLSRLSDPQLILVGDNHAGRQPLRPDDNAQVAVSPRRVVRVINSPEDWKLSLSFADIATDEWKSPDETGTLEFKAIGTGRHVLLIHQGTSVGTKQIHIDAGDDPFIVDLGQ